jgi:hypothetical protein
MFCSIIMYFSSLTIKVIAVVGLLYNPSIYGKEDIKKTHGINLKFICRNNFLRI